MLTNNCYLPKYLLQFSNVKYITLYAFYVPAKKSSICNQLAWKMYILQIPLNGRTSHKVTFTR
jgi:hypothetical protein